MQGCKLKSARLGVEHSDSIRRWRRKYTVSRESSRKEFENLEHVYIWEIEKDYARCPLGSQPIYLYGSKAKKSIINGSLFSYCGLCTPSRIAAAFSVRLLKCGTMIFARSLVGFIGGHQYYLQPHWIEEIRG